MAHRHKKEVARLKTTVQKMRTHLHRCEAELERARQAALGELWLAQNAEYVEILVPPSEDGSEEV
jgi:hypothetical protein